MTNKSKQTYQSVTLGLPPLKMVLVHAENDAKNEQANLIFDDNTKKKFEKKQVVRKIIEHLESDH